MKHNRQCAGIVSLLLLFHMIGLTACGTVSVETGHGGAVITAMENTPVINYTLPVLTPNVLVDQQGYASRGEKQAVVKSREPVDIFRLIDSNTGENVYEGRIKQSEYNEDLQLYIGTVDFTEFDQNGSFYLECDRVGQSLTFPIRDDYYEELLKTLCGKMHDSCRDRSVTEEDIITLLEACEWYPEVFTDDNGNGIPELLEDIADWLEKTANDTEKPEPETMSYVTALAKFSYLYQSYDEGYATECLKAADRAFQYARLNDSEKDQEDPFYFAAAAELYRASGQQYLYALTSEYLEQTLKENKKEKLDDITFLGYVTYISTKQRVDLNDCERITKILMEQAEEVSDLTRENPYLVSSRNTADHMELLDHVMKITMVNYMIANHEYETVIENHLHYFLGRNEQSICYLDHVGQKNYSEIDEGLGIMNQFEADSKLIFVLSEIVCTYGS